jgi:hypothetical protein
MAENQLGTAAADIYHQSSPVTTLHGTRDTQVNQARLFHTGDDVNGMTERLFRLLDELGCIVSGTEGIGADSANIAGVQFTQTLAKASQTGQCTPLCIDGQQVALIKPVCQANHFSVPVNDPHDAALQACNNHVETVGAKINRRNNLAAIFTGII